VLALGTLLMCFLSVIVGVNLIDVDLHTIVNNIMMISEVRDLGAYQFG